MVDDNTVVAPREASSEDLLVVHTQSYLDSLRVREQLISKHLTCTVEAFLIHTCKWTTLLTPALTNLHTGIQYAF